MLSSVEIATAASVVEETPWVSGVHDVVMIILFVASLLIVGIAAIEVVVGMLSKKTKWASEPLPTKISMISRGVIGLTVVFYVAYLFLTVGTWRWMTVFYTVIWPPILAAFFVGITAAVFLFLHQFLYKPVVYLVSGFKKKE